MNHKTKCPAHGGEMAEWVAESVLEMDICKCNAKSAKGKHWGSAEFGPMWGIKELVRWVYSPVGLVTVWQEVEKVRQFVGMEMYIPPEPELQGSAYSCTIRMVTAKEYYIGCGKDRYEAFYNAIWEVMGR
jgi:hypothetical protein